MLTKYLFAAVKGQKVKFNPLECKVAVAVLLCNEFDYNVPPTKLHKENSNAKPIYRASVRDGITHGSHDSKV